jgi:Leucine-rich repeat (LRR) protein
MVELEEVQLSKNTITAIPPLGGLTALKSFTINNNSLTEIPESIGKCAALEEFAAASNSIAAVPDRSFLRLARAPIKRRVYFSTLWDSLFSSFLHPRAATRAGSLLDVFQEWRGCTRMSLV